MSLDSGSVLRVIVIAELAILALLVGMKGPSIVGSFHSASYADLTGTCHEPRVLDTTTPAPHSRVQYNPPYPEMKPFTVTTNRDGFREEDVSISKSENTFRILLLGDSYTHGYGVNRSDRYGDRLEEKLNSSMERNVQVVNMAHPGWGMPSYHAALKQHGLKYEPDIIVVGFWLEDGLTIAAAEKMRSNLDFEETNKTGRLEELRAAKRNYIESEKSRTCLNRYMEKIQDTAADNSIDVVFYRIMKTGGSESGKLSPSSKTTVWEVSEDMGQERYRLPDGHYNEAGHEALATDLSHKLENRYLETGESG